MSKSLSPMQGGILRILEEAGEENICCIANTISLLPGALTDFYVALKELNRLGAIDTEIEFQKDVLAKKFGMVYRERSWYWPGEDPAPDVFLTEAGCALIRA